MGVFIDPSKQQSTISQGNSYEDTSSLSNDLNHTILEEYPRLSVHGEDLNSDHETLSTSQSRPSLTAHQQSHLRQNLCPQCEIRKPTRLIETIEGRKTPRALILVVSLLSLLPFMGLMPIIGKKPFNLS